VTYSSGGSWFAYKLIGPSDTPGCFVAEYHGGAEKHFRACLVGGKPCSHYFAMRLAGESSAKFPRDLFWLIALLKHKVYMAHLMRRVRRLGRQIR
jgi:hypothetical protein